MTELIDLVKNNLVDIELLKKKIHSNKGIVNTPDTSGRTILFYSANEEIAELLLSYGASINIKDSEGKTAREYNQYVDFVIKNKCFEKQRLMGLIR